VFSDADFPQIPIALPSDLNDHFPSIPEHCSFTSFLRKRERCEDRTVDPLGLSREIDNNQGLRRSASSPGY
jgi:hypothetical protein